MMAGGEEQLRVVARSVGLSDLESCQSHSLFFFFLAMKPGMEKPVKPA